MTFVRVAKDGAVLLVHPTTVASHENAGWAVSPDQSNTEDAPAPTSEPVAGDLASSGASGAAGTETPPVAIPADWADLHHNAKIKLAETILGGDDLVPVGGDTKTEAAIKVIAAEVAKRA